jgi:hypothetical protein
MLLQRGLIFLIMQMRFHPRSSVYSVSQVVYMSIALLFISLYLLTGVWVSKMCRLLGRLEGHALLSLEGNTELEQLHDDVGEVMHEGVVVLGVLLDVGLEALVLDQSHVGGQHHEGLGGDILELLGAVPLLVSPLLFHEELVVVVGKDGRGEGPGARETGAVGVAAAESVGTGESDDFLVVEAHTVEDGAEMLLLLGSIRETAVGSAVRNITVVAAGSPGDLGALHLLDGSNTSKSPEVRVGDPGELLLHGVEEVAGSVKTGIGTVVTLRGESHGSTVAATSLGLGIVGATGVPCETDKDGSVRAIVVLIVLNEELSDLVVDLLVILLSGCEDTSGLGLLCAVHIVETSTTSKGGNKTTDQEAIATLLSTGGISVATTARLSKGGARDEGGASLQ